MAVSRQNITPFLITIPILIVCGFIVYFDSSLNTCYGLFHGIRDLLLLLILVILSLVFFINQINKMMKHFGNKKNIILACITVLVAIIIAFQGKSTWKEIHLRNSFLKASISPNQLEFGRIELIDKSKYYAHYGHIDWSCAYTDKYEIKEDTLILRGNPFGKTDGIFTDKYVITDSNLIPVKTQNKDMKRTVILRIEKKNNP